MVDGALTFGGLVKEAQAELCQHISESASAVRRVLDGKGGTDLENLANALPQLSDIELPEHRLRALEDLLITRLHESITRPECQLCMLARDICSTDLGPFDPLPIGVIQEEGKFGLKLLALPLMHVPESGLTEGQKAAIFDSGRVVARKLFNESRVRVSDVYLSVSADHYCLVFEMEDDVPN